MNYSVKRAKFKFMSSLSKKRIKSSLTNNRWIDSPDDNIWKLSLMYSRLIGNNSWFLVTMIINGGTPAYYSENIIFDPYNFVPIKLYDYTENGGRFIPNFCTNIKFYRTFNIKNLISCNVYFEIENFSSLIYKNPINKYYANNEKYYDYALPIPYFGVDLNF